MPTIKQLEDQGRALAEDQKTLVLDETRPWSEKRDEYDKRARTSSPSSSSTAP
jgi:hypothetical protein